MIRVLIGDIFQSKALTLVNTVNCVRVMSKGYEQDLYNYILSWKKSLGSRRQAANNRSGNPESRNARMGEVTL
jgi:hypothetical protein